MKALILTLLLTGCAAHDALFVTPVTFPSESYSSPEEWAMIEARRLHRDERDNCVQVAETAKAMLASKGIPSEVVAYDTPGRVHVALCTERACLDNGLLSTGLYPRGEPRVAELVR